MTTSPVVQVTKGGATTSLTSGVPFAVDPKFRPPSTIAQPLLVEQNGQLQKLDERLLPRTWNVSVVVGGNTGMSDARVRRAVNGLDRTLRLAGDRNEPTYFEFGPNSDMPEPLWGTYGAYLRYEIISGRMILPEDYGVADLRSTALDCTLEILIVPYATNKQQRALTATGGLVPDVLGITDGAAVGWTVAEGTTNIIPNPIYAHSTATTGWAGQSSLVIQTTNDKKHCYPGSQTAIELTATAGSNNAYNIAVTSAAVTYVVTAYVRKRDGSAVTTADVECWEGSGAGVAGTTISSSVRAVRNGWYMVISAKYTGSAGARYFGVVVKSGKTIILGGVQVENKNFWTPLCHGDQVGSVWGGTAHNSTSTRTAATLRFSSSTGHYNLTSGCIRIVFTWGPASVTAVDMPGGGFPMFFDDDAGNAFQGGWEVSTQRFYFSASGTTTYSSATTITAGSTEVLHFVWGPGGRTLYRNGSSILTAATAARVEGAYITIGSNNAAGNYSNVSVMDLATFDVEPTSAQVSADYTNLSALMAAGERIAPIPFYWTRSGTYASYALVAGVPGTLPAAFWCYTGLNSYTTSEVIHLNRYSMPLDGFYPPDVNLVKDCSGTVAGAAYGGQVQTLAALGTTAVDIATLTFGGSVDKRWLWNNRLRAIAALTDTGANLVMALKISRAVDVYTDYLPVEDQPFTVWAITPEVRLAPVEYAVNTVSFAVSLKRTTGAANVTIDFYEILLGDLMRVRLRTGGSQRYYISNTGFFYMSYGGGAGPITMSDPEPFTGDNIYFEPERWNVINSFVYSGGTTYSQTWFNPAEFYVIPRYALL